MVKLKFLRKARIADVRRSNMAKKEWDMCSRCSCLGTLFCETDPTPGLHWYAGGLLRSAFLVARTCANLPPTPASFSCGALCVQPWAWLLVPLCEQHVVGSAAPILQIRTRQRSPSNPSVYRIEASALPNWPRYGFLAFAFVFQDMITPRGVHDG
jgi:hypothetical protein